MGRDFVINGETLVLVKGHNALSSPMDLDGQRRAYLWELGLAEGPVTVTPRFIHQDIKCDDFGPSIPAEVMCMLADVNISMNLIHFDWEVVQLCISDSMARPLNNALHVDLETWTMPGAGALMGNGLPLKTRGNFFISLNLTSPKLDRPWRFPSAMLINTVTIPLGTRRSVVQLQWRAIPYTTLRGATSADTGDPTSVASPGEIRSTGTVLWDRTLDTLTEVQYDPDGIPFPIA